MGRDKELKVGSDVQASLDPGGVDVGSSWVARLCGRAGDTALGSGVGQPVCFFVSGDACVARRPQETNRTLSFELEDQRPHAVREDNVGARGVVEFHDVRCEQAVGANV